MFYQWNGSRTFDGKTDYLDLSEYLHYFLQSKTLSADITFRTRSAGYLTLLAVYYKESLLPDFSLSLNKGRVVLTAKRRGGLTVLSGEDAWCDGENHTLSFRGSDTGVRVYMDGALVIEDSQPGPWCEFGYVGFATVARGVMADQYANFFEGELLALGFSEALEPVPEPAGEPRKPRMALFSRGMLGAENFRIPTIVTIDGGITVASADARMEAPGDNPNHICRAIRVSRDSGETWSEPRLMCDFGGIGRTDGAAAIDGSLLWDAEEKVLFMIFSHTSAGIGSAASTAGTGFEAGRKVLTGADGKRYACGEDRRVLDENGADRLFRQADTSFLKIIESRDGGDTWTEPRDLNPQIKEEWMRFIGAGPGTGIQLREGPHRGRLIYPVYMSFEGAAAHSSGVIYSDDHGRTWKLGAPVNDGRQFEGETIMAATASDPRASLGECQVTELPGGRLRIFLRNMYTDRTMAAYSDDGGDSWYGLAVQEQLKDPGCQSHVLRLTHEGRDLWLFSNPADGHQRVLGTVRASTDGTKTWSDGHLVEPGEYGYSCMTLLPDGQIGIMYEGRDITQWFAKFPVEKFLE